MIDKGARRALSRVLGLPQLGTIMTGTACARRGYGDGCSGSSTVIESVELEPDGRGGEVLIAAVRPKGGVGSRCSRRQRRCPG
jgi:hypothetical protein